MAKKPCVARCTPQFAFASITYATLILYFILNCFYKVKMFSLLFTAIGMLLTTVAIFSLAAEKNVPFPRLKKGFLLVLASLCVGLIAIMTCVLNDSDESALIWYAVGAFGYATLVQIAYIVVKERTAFSSQYLRPL
jgi:hypothetical protein